MDTWPTHLTITLNVTVRSADADAVRHMLLDALDGAPDHVTRLAHRSATIGEHEQFDDIHPPTEPRG